MRFERYGDRVHTACDLVDYVVDSVSIANNAAPVGMVPYENDLRLYRWIVPGFPLLVDFMELFLRKGSDNNQPHSFPVTERLEIDSN